MSFKASYSPPSPALLRVSVIAEVNVVFPWSICPNVPNIDHGAFVLSNFCLAIILSSSLGIGLLPNHHFFIFPKLSQFFAIAFGHFLIAHEMHIICPSALGSGISDL